MGSEDQQLAAAPCEALHAPSAPAASAPDGQADVDRLTPTAGASTSKNHQVQQRGSKADLYDRGQRIGKGAFGEIYLVVSKADRRLTYVLKSIKLARQTEWQRQASHREIYLYESLKHPYIVPLVDHWVAEQHTVNCILGYCEGGDLAAVSSRRKGKPFEESQLRLWLAQLLLALQYLEQECVLHRDLKPTNIFLSAAGHVLLGDFGLASVRDANDASSQHDQSMVGTPHFLSPELLSQQGYDHPTDVWSLGCVMYELSAQHPAFTAFNLPGLVHKIKHRAVAALPAGYSKEWEALIKLMLRKDPGTRFTPSQLLACPCMAESVKAALDTAQHLQPDLKLQPMQRMQPMLSPRPVMVAPTVDHAVGAQLGEGQAVQAVLGDGRAGQAVQEGDGQVVRAVLGQDNAAQAVQAREGQPSHGPSLRTANPVASPSPGPAFASAPVLGLVQGPSASLVSAPTPTPGPCLDLGPGPGPASAPAPGLSPDLGPVPAPIPGPGLSSNPRHFPADGLMHLVTAQHALKLVLKAVQPITPVVKTGLTAQADTLAITRRQLDSPATRTALHAARAAYSAARMAGRRVCAAVAKARRAPDGSVGSAGQEVESGDVVGSLVPRVGLRAGRAAHARVGAAGRQGKEGGATAPLAPRALRATSAPARHRTSVPVTAPTAGAFPSRARAASDAPHVPSDVAHAASDALHVARRRGSSVQPTPTHPGPAPSRVRSQDAPLSTLTLPATQWVVKRPPAAPRAGLPAPLHGAPHPPTHAQIASHPVPPHGAPPRVTLVTPPVTLTRCTSPPPVEAEPNLPGCPAAAAEQLGVTGSPGSPGNLRSASSRRSTHSVIGAYTSSPVNALSHLSPRVESDPDEASTCSTVGDGAFRTSKLPQHAGKGGPPVISSSGIPHEAHAAAASPGRSSTGSNGTSTLIAGKSPTVVGGGCVSRGLPLGSSNSSRSSHPDFLALDGSSSLSQAALSHNLAAAPTTATIPVVLPQQSQVSQHSQDTQLAQQHSQQAQHATQHTQHTSITQDAPAKPARKRWALPGTTVVPPASVPPKSLRRNSMSANTAAPAPGIPHSSPNPTSAPAPLTTSAAPSPQAPVMAAPSVAAPSPEGPSPVGPSPPAPSLSSPSPAALALHVASTVAPGITESGKRVRDTDPSPPRSSAMPVCMGGATTDTMEGDAEIAETTSGTREKVTISRSRVRRSKRWGAKGRSATGAETVVGAASGAGEAQGNGHGVGEGEGGGSEDVGEPEGEGDVMGPVSDTAGSGTVLESVYSSHHRRDMPVNVGPERGHLACESAGVASLRSTLPRLRHLRQNLSKRIPLAAPLTGPALAPRTRPDPVPLTGPAAASAPAPGPVPTSAAGTRAPNLARTSAPPRSTAPRTSSAVKSGASTRQAPPAHPRSSTIHARLPAAPDLPAAPAQCAKGISVSDTGEASQQKGLTPRAPGHAPAMHALPHNHPPDTPATHPSHPPTTHAAHPRLSGVSASVVESSLGCPTRQTAETTTSLIDGNFACPALTAALRANGSFSSQTQANMSQGLAGSSPDAAFMVEGSYTSPVKTKGRGSPSWAGCAVWSPMANAHGQSSAVDWTARMDQYGCPSTGPEVSQNSLSLPWGGGQQYMAGVDVSPNLSITRPPQHHSPGAILWAHADDAWAAHAVHAEGEQPLTPCSGTVTRTVACPDGLTLQGDLHPQPHPGWGEGVGLGLTPIAGSPSSPPYSTATISALPPSGGGAIGPSVPVLCWTGAAGEGEAGDRVTGESGISVHGRPHGLHGPPHEGEPFMVANALFGARRTMASSAASTQSQAGVPGGEGDGGPAQVPRAAGMRTRRMSATVAAPPPWKVGAIRPGWGLSSDGQPQPGTSYKANVAKTMARAVTPPLHPTATSPHMGTTPPYRNATPPPPRSSAHKSLPPVGDSSLTSGLPPGQGLQGQALPEGRHEEAVPVVVSSPFSPARTPSTSVGYGEAVQAAGGVLSGGEHSQQSDTGGLCVGERARLDELEALVGRMKQLWVQGSVGEVGQLLRAG